MVIDSGARTGFPTILGHEWAGTVAAAGTNVDTALVGMRCAADNMLSVGGEVGFEHPGGYGEYFVTEADNLFGKNSSLPCRKGSYYTNQHQKQQDICQDGQS